MDDPTGACRLPEIRVLGRVSITADGPMNPAHVRRLTELGAYLALAQRPPSPEKVIEAVWPGRYPTASTRYACLSRLRSWWGTDETGDPYLARHTLTVRAWSDWARMKTLVGWAGGPADLSTVATEDLVAALTLIHGRPFARATWIEHSWVDPIRRDIEYLVDGIAGEVLARGDGFGPAARLALDARAVVVPWAADLRPSGG
jgi:hypothetical protein